MLKHHDRRELKKIERLLEASDPALARTLGGGFTAGRPGVWKALLVLSDITVALMLVVGIATDSGSWFMEGLLGLALVAWIHGVRRPGRPKNENS